MNMMIVKTFGVDFNSNGALTLNVSEVSTEKVKNGTHSRIHESGWTISGKVNEDYYVWVNEFEASHKTYGRVWGDFEDKVYADSEEGFQHFYSHHTPEEWNYYDI